MLIVMIKSKYGDANELKMITDKPELANELKDNLEQSGKLCNDRFVEVISVPSDVILTEDVIY